MRSSSSSLNIHIILENNKTIDCNLVISITIILFSNLSDICAYVPYQKPEVILNEGLLHCSHAAMLLLLFIQQFKSKLAVHQPERVDLMGLMVQPLYTH